MKNKKGVSICRIILYIIFIFLFIAFIWSLVITFKAMKKEPCVTDDQPNSSLKMVYNNNFDYSATTYFENYYINFYSTNNIVRDINNNSFPINNVANITNTLNFNNSVQTLYQFAEYGVPYSPYTTRYYFDDNVFHVASVMKNFYNIAYNGNEYIDNLGGEQYYNFFNIFHSACIVINCDIPYSIFNFTSTNSQLADSFYFYIKGDNSNNFYTCSASSKSFSSSSIPSTFITQGNSHITKLVLPVWQSYDSNGYNGYVPYAGWSGQYLAVLQNPITINFDFQVYSASSDWQDGYDKGFEDGEKAVNDSLQEINDNLSIENATLTYELNGANATINEQRTLISSLQAQIDSFNSGQYSFKNLFWTIADTPFKTMHNVLNFDFFGVNLFRFFVGVITSLGMIWLIKKFI